MTTSMQRENDLRDRESPRFLLSMGVFEEVLNVQVEVSGHIPRPNAGHGATVLEVLSFAEALVFPKRTRTPPLL